MNTPDAILVQLLSARQTDAALGQSLRLPFLVTRAMCQRHEKAGLVTHDDIAGIVPVWSLTEAGKARAEALQAPLQPQP